MHTLFKDDVNFSISTDGPTINGQWMLEERRMLINDAGLTTDQLQKANFKAAHACFLEGDDKEDLVNHVRSESGSGNI